MRIYNKINFCFFRLREDTALQSCIERAKAYAPYSDLIWMETSHPTLSDAKEFAEGNFYN